MRRLLAALSGLTLLTSCFSGLFAQQPAYQATAYVVEFPRIVALQFDPPRVEVGVPITLNALVLAPDGAEVQQSTASICGLGRDVPTFIFDLNCFEDQDEAQELVRGDLPLTFTAPDTPLVTDCDVEDTGLDTGFDFGADVPAGWPCPHILPILVETQVDGEPTFAVSYVQYFTGPVPEDAPAGLADIQISLSVPDAVAPGEQVQLEVLAYGDYRRDTFHWYVEGGTLLDTGVTTGHAYVPPDENNPLGATLSTNRWVVHDDAQGDLRVWVVLHQPGAAFFGDSDDVLAADMVWRQASTQVSP
jgi:hypothetical protein